MKLKIKSNYWEPWFSFFDLEGDEFRLVTTDGPSRPEMFNLFKKLGISTPLFGKYDNFIENQFPDDRKVVIYDDIRSHCGENKQLITFSDINEADKSKFMSEYIKSTIFPTQIFNSKSTRYLFIGDCGFQYDYYSYDDWRSNCGEGIIGKPTNLKIPEWRNQINYAMFSIDFVGEQHELKAIDFNCAPGIYGVKLGLSSIEIVLAIKTWLQNKINHA